MQRDLIAVDWDGTCVHAFWAGERKGTWQDGAIEALHLLSYGYEVVIWTDRANHAEAWRGDMPPACREIRTMLDEAGLTGIRIWTQPGKPPAYRFIDNRAIRYRGNWEEILPLLGIGGPHA